MICSVTSKYVKIEGYCKFGLEIKLNIPTTNVNNNYKIRQTIYRYKANHDDYNAIMAAAIADRLAEAFAEYLHHIVRTNLWGYSNDEDLSATGKKSWNHS